MSKFGSRLEQFIYFGIAALMVWVPFPLASNRPFLRSLIVCWVLVLAMLWLLGWIAGTVRPGQVFRSGAVSLALLTGWLAVILIQILPMPAEWLGMFSPASLHAYQDSALGAITPRLSISIERNDSIQYLYLGVAYFCLMALILAIADDRYKLQGLCLSVVLSGTVQAMMGILLHFSGAEYSLFFKHISHVDAVTGGFVNRNSMAAFMEICLGCGIGLMVAQFGDTPIRSIKQRLRWLIKLLLSPKLILRVLLIVMVLALILTRSRMGNGAFFAATLSVGLLGLLLIRNSGRAITIFLISMIAFDILVIGSWFGVDKVAKRIEETAVTRSERQSSGADEESLEERGIPASATLTAWKDFPVFGAGSGTFAYLYPQYRPGEPVGFYEHAHNDYAEFLLEGGALGFGFLVLLYVTTMATAVRAMRKAGDQGRRGIAMGCVFAMLSVALHMVVDMPLQIPANAVAMCLVFALSMLSSANGRARSRSSESVGGEDAASFVAKNQ
jgi:O-antigen ligase